MRVAVIKESECEAPDNCDYVCAAVCPRVREGFTHTVYAKENKKAAIDEDLCISCGICVKRCPFDAIRIINLPDEMARELVFQYGQNAFRTFNIASPMEGKIIGLVGRNGIGKTTNVNLVSGDLVPNFGAFQNPPQKTEVLKRFRGKDIQPYLTRLYEGGVSVSKKPQDIVLSGRVSDIVTENKYGLVRKELMDRDAQTLSGGETQLVAIARALDADSSVYILDEPMNYLDIAHRIKIAEAVRTNLVGKTTVVVEHDLIMLDYLTDFIQILYGSDANYGIASHLMVSRNGINSYIKGYLPVENVRFRDYEIKIRKTLGAGTSHEVVSWPDFETEVGRFRLKTKAGKLFEGDIVGVIGENGIGKTTFMRSLVGLIDTNVGRLNLGIKIGYKPQFIQRFTALVGDVFSGIKPAYGDDRDFQDLINKMEVNKLLNKNVNSLSGGELQKVAIITTLMSNADVFMLDEPSANLDIEDRLNVMSVISSFVSSKKKCAIVVDHDVMFLDSVCSKTILFRGEGGKSGFSDEIVETTEAINNFLKRAGVTMRRDSETGRPRINQRGSRMDSEQKASGRFFSE